MNLTLSDFQFLSLSLLMEMVETFTNSKGSNTRKGTQEDIDRFF
jgi:hypothetical protein